MLLYRCIKVSTGRAPLRDKLRGANYDPCTDTSSNLILCITDISGIYNEDVSARAKTARTLQV